MTRHPFGWDLPPGCTLRDIDEAVGDAPETCEVCGYEDCDDEKTCAVVCERDALRTRMRTARKALLKIATSGAHEWERRIAEDALAVVGDK